MKIGDRIKSRRLELGLSVDYIAEKLGKNRATIYRYENEDIKDLPITILEPLSKVLNTTPADLMGWEDDTNKPRTANSSKSYYTNPETAQIAQEIYENKELSLLFDAARDAKPEDLKQVHDMLLFLKQKEHNE